jgi:hypothetical protein
VRGIDGKAVLGRGARQLPGVEERRPAEAFTLLEALDAAAFEQEANPTTPVVRRQRAFGVWQDSPRGVEVALESLSSGELRQ